MTRLLAILVVSASAAAAASAAPFADPMRPPGALDDDQAAPVATGPRLESVLIAPDRRIAVISGEQVTVGSSFRDGRIVRITESEVVIRRAGGDESLKLFAAAGKRPSPRGRGK